MYAPPPEDNASFLLSVFEGPDFETKKIGILELWCFQIKENTTHKSF